MSGVTAEASLRHTPLLPVHRELGAKLVPFAGFLMPVLYTSIAAEHRAVRERAGLFDISHMGEFHVMGPGAATFLDRVTVNRVADLEPGRAQYSCLCRPDGGILDDIVIYRLRDGFQVVVNASNVEKDLAWLRELLPPQGVALEDRSESTALLALQGPAAESILAPLVDVDLTTLRYYAAVEGTVGGVPALVARTGYTGEDGFELYVDAGRVVELWRTLADAGAGAGLLPAGLGARDTLRLEMAYPLYGNDIDEETNPLEAGLGWIVKLDKGDFIGAETLRRVKREGPRRRLVGFQLRERGFPRAGYPVLVDGGRDGVVRSGTVSPTLGEGIGTAYLPADRARPGTAVAVEVRGRALEAEVVRTPFYRGGSIRR